MEAVFIGISQKVDKRLTFVSSEREGMILNSFSRQMFGWLGFMAYKPFFTNHIKKL